MADPVRDFLATDDNEWAVANGDFVGASGQPAVKQGIRIKVGMFLGESFLDDAVGTDYYGVILVKNPDPLEVRAELQQRIADTPDVTNVYGSDLLGPDGQRQASISYVADSVYSQNPFSDILGLP